MKRRMTNQQLEKQCAECIDVRFDPRAMPPLPLFKVHVYRGVPRMLPVGCAMNFSA